MKKIIIITVLITLAVNGFAQEIHYDFAETIESGQTLYFLKGYYGPHDVMVTYPCYHDTIIYNPAGASTQITTYYYGYEEPSGDLVIPATIIHNDTVYTITTIGYNAFWKCAEITSLTLPNTLNSIIQGAFAGCTGITGEVRIPDAVTHLGDDAFRSCTNLNSVVFGIALQKIGWASFKGCTSLEHISSLPESLTRIYDKAFEGCVSLSGTIVIPSQITQIDEKSFAYCNITSVVIPEGVTKIKRGAFAGCPLDSLYISSSVTSISVDDSYGIGAFRGCSRLQSIIVNEANPFYDSRGNCNALIETATNKLLKGGLGTVIPEDIEIIGNYAFDNNEMTDITIPSSIERLEEGAFFGCNLSTITLPSSVSYIGDKALCCNSLTSIICKSPIPPTAFNEVIQYVGPYNSFLWTEFWVDRDIPIHIPFGTTIAYQNASGWDYFNNFIETETNLGGEWYYEIQNDDGSITYQHLEYASDTTIGNQRPKVIVRSNTHYDRNEIIEITHEYVYEENGIVYWWNKDLEEFTTLYNLNAETGDEWTIKVGNNSLVMHVDAVENVEYEGQIFRLLHVSDPDDLFSGDIVCGIGHLTSFFPERLMNRSKGFRVDGLRCYWVEGDLVFKIGDEDCDAIYAELHNGIEETHENVFTVYPNPANDVLFIETRFIASQPDRTKYSITNLMGQTVMTGVLDVRLPQCDSPTTIDVSNLPAGMYFISVGEQTVKFVVR